ncbi:MAG TPA: hypothetical protein VFV76_14335 [Actinomycetes bacterium]|nr:hypothetical protein [Actinomycetes bacterium]
MSQVQGLLPGDVVLTRSKGWVGWIIRLGAALLDRPNIRNHVIVVHHRDDAGTLWGIEGKPGGVGWVDMTTVLRHRLTSDNRNQPKDTRQRATICAAVEAAIQRPYDWGAIAHAAAESLRLDELWWRVEFREDDTIPAGVICSALADWAYERTGLASPGGTGRTRYTTPADWDHFIQSRDWELTDAGTA